jgi:hypothetical protein
LVSIRTPLLVRYSIAGMAIRRALNKVLKRIKDILGGYPTVLWTGNGCHIYQPEIYNDSPKI